MIRRCLKRDKEAWDELVAKYSRLIYNYIYSIFRDKGRIPDTDVISDIYQGVFFSLVQHNCRKLRSFKGRNNCSLSSWLRIITVNFTLDYVRKKHGDEISLEEGPVNQAQLKDILADKRAEADEAVLDKERWAQLTECIKTLNTQERYFVHMHIYQYLEMEDMARLLKVGRSAADMRKSRIIGKLKECFRRKNFM